jgi:hypothetical protein
MLVFEIAIKAQRNGMEQIRPQDHSDEEFENADSPTHNSSQPVSNVTVERELP